MYLYFPDTPRIYDSVTAVRFLVVGGCVLTSVCVSAQRNEIILIAFSTRGIVTDWLEISKLKSSIMSVFYVSEVTFLTCFFDFCVLSDKERNPLAVD
jgi:hypothetical protein